MHSMGHSTADYANSNAQDAKKEVENLKMEVARFKKEMIEKLEIKWTNGQMFHDGKIMVTKTHPKIELLFKGEVISTIEIK